MLILGESGAGKELAARMLHKLGHRRDRPFCAINCAALPDDLLETELFGHARGAFTGAAAERRGVFEEAHTGTLFLDEVGELSPRAQAKLLRAIQEGEIRRLGENVSRRVDVRVITATNRDLRKEAAADRFRLDLLYRLDVIRIALPPLRERPEDIPVLVNHFWRDATERVGSGRRWRRQRSRRSRAIDGLGTFASCRTCSPRWLFGRRGAGSSHLRHCQPNSEASGPAAEFRLRLRGKPSTARSSARRWSAPADNAVARRRNSGSRGRVSRS